VVDALPRTPSGKLDRRAIGEACARTCGVGGERVAPRDARENRLANVWSAVLGVPEVGVHDSFFDLGGHSLTAARAAALATRELGFEVSVRDVFANPTVAQLAAYLSDLQWMSTSAPASDIEQRASEDVIL
jgi:hypothetical protein